MTQNIYLSDNEVYMELMGETKIEVKMYFQGAT